MRRALSIWIPRYFVGRLPIRAGALRIDRAGRMWRKETLPLRADLGRKQAEENLPSLRPARPERQELFKVFWAANHRKSSYQRCRIQGSRDFGKRHFIICPRLLDDIYQAIAERLRRR